LTLTRYQEVHLRCPCLIPLYIPLVSNAVNRWLATPVIPLGLASDLYDRTASQQDSRRRSLKTSVVVPARNEAGNIARLLDELLSWRYLRSDICRGAFEGRTWKEIQRQIESHPRRRNSCFRHFSRPEKAKPMRRVSGFPKPPEMFFLLTRIIGPAGRSDPFL